MAIREKIWEMRGELNYLNLGNRQENKKEVLGIKEFFKDPLEEKDVLENRHQNDS